MQSALFMRGLLVASTPKAQSVGLALAAGVLLAALGPFGNYLNGGLPERIGYWCAVSLLGLVLYGCAFRVVAARVPVDSRGWWPAIIGTTLVVSLPQAMVTRLWAFQLWPELGRLDLPVALWFVQTTVIGLAAMIGVAIMHRRAARATRGTLGSSEQQQPFAAAQALFGRDVLALQMEDHYVRIHRATGSELVLVPLGRAIERVEAEGLRTHRSWWVAAHAVVRVEGDARSMRLCLTNGVIAPVARSAVAQLRAAGWIGTT